MDAWRLLVVIGGLAAAVSGFASIATGTPLGERLLGINLVEGSIVRVMGAVGVFGGVLSLYSAARGNARLGLLGGLLGLLAPCALSLLAVAGGLIGSRGG